VRLFLLFHREPTRLTDISPVGHPTGDNRWDEKAGLWRDALSSQVIDALGAHEISGRNPKGFSLATSEALSPPLQVALAPLLSALEAITARIREYDAQIEKLAEESYPETALLKQVKGVGTVIALTYVLTFEDPRRFRKSRDAGCFVGLQPARRNSGQSEPQLHIT